MWKQLGKGWVFTRPLFNNSEICIHVGKVTPRSDDRWNWFLIPNRYNQAGIRKHEQGVVKTLDEAKSLVENRNLFIKEESQVL